MIKGIGTDILQVSRILKSHQRFGDRLSHRLLVESELASMTAKTDPARFLAKRFAAKEAILKALGTGLAKGISWHDIEISNDAIGRPLVALSGGALSRLSQLSAEEVHLSISDEQDYVVAFAVVE